MRVHYFAGNNHIYSWQKGGYNLDCFNLFAHFKLYQYVET